MCIPFAMPLSTTERRLGPSVARTLLINRTHLCFCPHHHNLSWRTWPRTHLKSGGRLCASLEIMESGENHWGCTGSLFFFNCPLRCLGACVFLRRRDRLSPHSIPSFMESVLMEFPPEASSYVRRGSNGRLKQWCPLMPWRV